MNQSESHEPRRMVVYVSTGTTGTIDVYGMDAQTGNLTPVSRFETGGSVMPMAIGPDGRHLYAAIRSEPYRVLTLAINPVTGELKHEASAPLPESMAYISMDPKGRALLGASYGGNMVAALPIGSEGLVSQSGAQVIPTGRNAHSIVTDRSGRYVYATNLGSDTVLQFVLNSETGLLEANEPPHIATGKGFGPRHIIVSPDNRHVYVLTELTGHVIHYALDSTTGVLTEVESVSSVPEGADLSPGLAPPLPSARAVSSVHADDGKPKIWAADIGITPNGRFLYTTERTTSTIALFRIGEDGRLSRVVHYSTERQPRGIRIDPVGRYLVASGEKSENFSVYSIDAASGELAILGRYPVSVGANWIEIATLA
ncbi:beta-propeller fold lactonase family protein [Rhizobium sp. P38BS-XIX]|uniref:lactonase family protein n=1 Tax=Rhizobium sp. P38BS-XIX TaxID=2726740 RepID=UPI0014575FE5|nr:beta-propeller fold lactonase family protein [Rhizobium sp. P38BS-XIX]NLS00912.1 beta-propeller fold lactonase family protein [Rhizobium sp. P38BS-XIX]